MRTGRDVWIVAALFAMGLVLRLAWLDVPQLAHDEPFTVYWAMQPFHSLMGMFADENNPPLHFLLMHVWVRLVPGTEFWLRLPSAVFGALCVVPLFLLGRSLAGSRVGITASLLFLASSMHQSFAQEVRAYSLLTLLTILAFWCLRRAAMGARYHTAPLALVAILLVHTHFMAWPVLAVMAGIVILSRAWRRAWRTLLKAYLITAIAFVPYASTFVRRAGTSIAEGTWLQPPDWEEPYNMLWRWSNAPVVVVIFLVVILWAAWARPQVRAAMALPALWALAPLLGLFVLSYLVPLYLDRYLLFAAPGYILLVALAADALVGHPGFRWLPNMVVLGLMAFTFKPNDGARPEPKRVVNAVAVQRALHPDLPVYVSPHWYKLTFLWHFDKDLFMGLDPADRFDPMLLLPADGSTGRSEVGALVLLVGNVHPVGEGIPMTFRSVEPVSETTPERGVTLLQYSRP